MVKISGWGFLKEESVYNGKQGWGKGKLNSDELDSHLKERFPSTNKMLGCLLKPPKGQKDDD